MTAAPSTQPAACRTCGRTYADDVLICPADGTQLPLEGRLLDGKFRLDRRLGHGGMATVWQATNELIERPVAIKLMHARYAEDADLLARFRNEATAAGRIGSPHICDVLDFGRSAVGPYIVMELLGGCSLNDLVHAYRRLDPGLAVWILRQALAGLDAAHRAGIVHRDLKPENIYLCRSIRDQWLVKLMDFGISKFTDSIRTGAGTMMGSPNYMAPEQIHGAASVDARADLWSVGVILYESISGKQPFARDTIPDSLTAVRTYEPPPLHTLLPSVPPGLSDITARCLRKQPDQRWPSALALAQALLPFERVRPQAGAAPEPRGDVPRASATMPKSGALPRALVDFIGDKPPSGPYPPVPSGKTGGHPPVVAARSAGRDKTPSSAHPPVSAGRDKTPLGAAPLAAGRDKTPLAQPAGPQRPSGPFKPVPRALSMSTGNQRAAAAPQPARTAAAPTGPRKDPAALADDPITRPLPVARARDPQVLWIFLGLVAIGALVAATILIAL